MPAGDDEVSESLPAASSALLLPLAVKAADAGAYERVTELFCAACTTGLTADEAGRWQRLLIEAGDFASARTAATLAGSSFDPEAELRTHPSSDLKSESDTDEFLDFDPGAREPVTPAAPAPLVAAFRRWFGGRSDVYARQWYDARRDRSGYWPVREELSASVIELHLLGRVTLGQYVLHPDSTVSFAALDLDPTPTALEQLRIAADGEGGLACPAMGEYARRLLQAAASAGLPALAEDTGGVGLHLWWFFEPRLAAARARALLRELLWRAGPQPPAVAVEIFPKQDQLSGKGLGNLVKLPLGVHQVTMRPSRLLDAELQPIDPAAALGRVRACDPQALAGVLASKVVAFPGTAADSTQSPEAPPAPTGPTPRALAAALAATPSGPVAHAAADRMLAGCAVVRELARRAHEEHVLAPDEARALLYTVGLVSRANERIDAAFARAGISRKELERVRRGLQGPMGCAKLRARFSTLCAGCVCPSPAEGGYATPALFAFQKPPPNVRRMQPWPDIEDAGSPLPHEPTRDDAIEQRLARIEAALQRLVPEPQDDDA
jgi:hypothetical protein